ncbi:pantoate--beta-alanine ligase [Deinococcus lacus]|uniref:Pantothenate synthetase n=1 Tax=Deinococcus lacus TaxID=392561 RepID=A0ABW1Y9X2_9DEIO
MLETVADLRAWRAAQASGSVGLVPTMGALHQGHAELIRRAQAENSAVVVSVFVNPAQFGPGEDLSRYPRTLPRDLELSGGAGASALFHPSADEMYPAGFSTRVQVSGVTERLEGALRPGHFEGVATVVLKLLELARPDRVYFGEKDWQQLAVVRRMVLDLNVPCEVVGVPTVRDTEESPGLALSSRNAYLTPDQRVRATVLSRALRAMQAAYAGGEHEVGALLGAGQAVLAQEPELSTDYLELVGPDLQPLTGSLDAEVAAKARLVLAARLFGVRLIDNMPLLHFAGK